ncbi:MAG: pyridoxamine 5'-phosphate oxidase family protein, partial [Acidimicrobiia bacterium]|nr:pyridoxamine 5'-phosphate oxidase family protein [Acidimicrobiia bacterium]
MSFTAAELTYLREQPIGHLCTVDRNGAPQIRPVGVHVSPDQEGIDIGGHALASTQKWRNVIGNPQV